MSKRDNKRGAGKSSMREKVRQRAEERESSGGGGWLVGDGLAFFSPKKGTSNFRVLPYEVTADDHPEVPAGELWYQRTVWVHYEVGADNKSVVCPLKTIKQRCPICEYRNKLMKDPNADEDTIKALNPRERELFNVLVDGEDEPQLLTMSYHCFGKKLEEEVREGEEEWGGFADLEGGYLLSVRFQEKKLGKNTFLEASRIDFKQDDDIDEGILSEVYNLDDIINIMDFDEIAAMFEEAEDEPPPKRGSGSSRRGGKKEEEEPAGRSSRRGGRKEPEPEPEPSGRSSRRGGRKEERQEEPEPEKETRSSRRGSSRGTPKEEEPETRGGGRSSRRGTKPDPEPEPDGDEDCPHGFTYAKSCNTHEECDECDLWDQCQKAQDAAKNKGGRGRR